MQGGVGEWMVRIGEEMWCGRSIVDADAVRSGHGECKNVWIRYCNACMCVCRDCMYGEVQRGTVER